MKEAIVNNNNLHVLPHNEVVRQQSLPVITHHSTLYPTGSYHRTMLICLNITFSTSGASTVCVCSLCLYLTVSCMPCRPTPITLPKTRPNLFFFWIKSGAQNTTLTPKTNESLLHREKREIFQDLLMY